MEKALAEFAPKLQASREITWGKDAIERALPKHICSKVYYCLAGSSFAFAAAWCAVVLLLLLLLLLCYCDCDHVAMPKGGGCGLCCWVAPVLVAGA